MPALHVADRHPPRCARKGEERALMAAEVRAGLTARPLPIPPLEVLLRRPRRRALRRDHPPARVLPDPHRGGDAARRRSGRRGAAPAAPPRRARAPGSGARCACCSTRWRAAGTLESCTLLDISEAALVGVGAAAARRVAGTADGGRGRRLPDRSARGGAGRRRACWPSWGARSATSIRATCRPSSAPRPRSSLPATACSSGSTS